jgi:16S rRNA (cytidine1402-2'-O)-methyltransferase
VTSGTGLESGTQAAARGTLYVVATPIGNLADVTLRALEVLRTVAVIAAEDTRVTRRLLARHGITTRLVSHHAHSGGARTAALLDRLDAGEDVALVTDAGTPLVSDPGEELVNGWIARGGRVVPVPGPSSALAALVASGLPAARWCFEGFLPRRGAERRQRLARIAGEDRATVLFEAPGRVAATLRELEAACGADRPAAVCRELTKVHEEVRRGTLGELAAGAAADPPRGEVTIVVGGRAAPAGGARGVAAHAGLGAVGSSVGDAAGTDRRARRRSARERVDVLVAGGMPRAAAARQVARETGFARRELFADAGSAATDEPREPVVSGESP